MPPKITRVRWDAQNVPWGLSFDENTGIFSGTPEVAGDYTVPVTVETNYGSDTKDVRVIAKGGKGLYRVALGSTPTFSIVNEVPHPTALSQYPYGFRAYTQSGNVYGCGLTGVPYITQSPSSAKSTHSQVSGQIDNLGDLSSLNNVRAVDVTRSLYTRYPIYNNVLSCAFLGADNKMTLSHVLYFTTQVSSGSERVNSWLSTVDGEEVKNVPVSDIGWNAQGISWLSEDGYQYSYETYRLTGTGTINATAHSTIVTQDLGYRAVKLISSNSFRFLSEDKLLDNNAENFPHGVIKDAWGYDNSVYVQTVDNQLYEYIYDSNEWELLGTYDVKKIVILIDRCVLMLTNSGELYHKGYRADDTFYIHETLTRVIPSYRFIDFASRSPLLDNNVKGTLYVIME